MVSIVRFIQIISHHLNQKEIFISDLIKESIQIFGHDVYYMDRQSVAEDTIFGEDALNKFNTQHPIEMYVEDGEGMLVTKR